METWWALHRKENRQNILNIFMTNIIFFSIVHFYVFKIKLKAETFLMAMKILLVDLFWVWVNLNQAQLLAFESY